MEMFFFLSDLRTFEKCLALSSPYPALCSWRHEQVLAESPPMQAEQAPLSTPPVHCVLQPSSHLGATLLKFLQFDNVFLVLETSKLDTVLQIWPLKCWTEGSIMHLSLLSVCLPVEAWRLLASAARTRWCSTCCLAGPPVSFWGDLLSPQSGPSLHYCMTLLHPRCRNSYIYLSLMVMKCLSTHLPTCWGLSDSSGALQGIGCSSVLPSMNLLRICSHSHC